MLFRKRVLGTIGYLGGLPAVLEEFAWSLAQLVQFNSEYLANPFAGEIVHYAKATVSLHWFARNSLVEQMQGDWLLMLDTDHAPPPDLAVRMLTTMNACGIDVATALYRHKAKNGPPVIYQWDASGTHAQPIAGWNRSVKAMEIGSAGGGALMVRRSVFARIERELKCKAFDPMPPYGEDHAFFQRLRALGIKSYALLEIESPHLTVQPITMDTYVPPPVEASERLDVGGFAWQP